MAEFARDTPVHAVFGVDDDTAVAAAAISAALGLPHNPPAAVEAARDKHRQRELLAAAGVPVPAFRCRDFDEPVERAAQETRYPAVIKPLTLAASRGVIRVNGRAELVAARERLRGILATPDVASKPADAQRYLVETFVPGPEFALEGLVVEGRLHVLAVFDKPDPLDGPYFEETIYVTPSRFPPAVRQDLVSCAQRAVAALGLERGPVHIELRHNAAGPWLIELAARPIGGKCGQVLRFGSDGGISLEQLLLGRALGQGGDVPAREPIAAGVMMIPTPRAGFFRRVDGLAAAQGVPGVTGIAITAHSGQRVVPLPEESRYLGFIFARHPDPDVVERALRKAHGRLTIVIE